jgi:hypothetical protein
LALLVDDLARDNVSEVSTTVTFRISSELGDPEMNGRQQMFPVTEGLPQLQLRYVAPEVRQHLLLHRPRGITGRGENHLFALLAVVGQLMVGGDLVRESGITRH